MTASELARRRAALRSRSPHALGPRVVVVIGPPCSGKSTYVAEHVEPGDAVVDFDALAVAAGSPRGHDHDEPHQSLAHAARDAMIERFGRTSGRRLWVLATSVRQLPQWRLDGAERVVLDTPLGECERRAVAANRSPDVIEVIRRWTG